MRVKPDPSVFEKYAHEYDLMTNAKQREINHSAEVQAIVKRFSPSAVLDAGCATGLTASLFARAGIPTVGLDRSQKMLSEARGKFGAYPYPLTFRYGHFERLPKALSGQFDLVVSLANSLSGVKTQRELSITLRNFHKVLKPGGNLVLQLLNYEGFKEGEIRPIRITENDKITYFRFSERRGKRFYIYAIRLDRRGKQPEFEVFRHEFDNFSASEIAQALKSSGLSNIKKFGDLLFQKKFLKSSRDIIITACRES